MDRGGSNGPDTWLDEHGDYLLQYAFVRLRNRAAAEDALQETFLAAIKAFERYDGKTLFAIGSEAFFAIKSSITFAKHLEK